MTDSDRYYVSKKSESYHCCFEASVMDRVRQQTVKCSDSEIVCECFELADAQRICNSLNAVNLLTALDEDRPPFDMVSSSDDYSEAVEIIRDVADGKELRKHRNDTGVSDEKNRRAQVFERP